MIHRIEEGWREWADSSAPHPGAALPRFVRGHLVPCYNSLIDKPGHGGSEEVRAGGMKGVWLHKHTGTVKVLQPHPHQPYCWKEIIGTRDWCIRRWLQDRSQIQVSSSSYKKNMGTSSLDLTVWTYTTARFHSHVLHSIAPSSIVNIVVMLAQGVFRLCVKKRWCRKR